MKPPILLIKSFYFLLFGLGAWLLFPTTYTFADNPLIMDQFTADPTARVFEGQMYVYPSHDILANPDRGREGWFCMEDYHVFSSENLMDWRDHGVIVSQSKVDWVDAATYSMWAPDCVLNDGMYYFYFPARNEAGDFGIGVAVSDTPYGPFRPEPTPIKGIRGIDPCVFIDKDGSAYLFYSAGKIYGVKLKDNMLEVDSEPRHIDTLPQVGLLEGPFVFEYKGTYYLTYPHVQNEIERLEYATSNSPMGPYQHAGVIMDESPTRCWTAHHSIVEYQGQWLLFYHEKDLSPDFDKCRSIRAEYLYFNNDGTIRKVTPTLRGVGICDAGSRIQVDRYSAVSENGTTVSFLNDSNPQEGWEITLSTPHAWVRYDRVDFSKTISSSVALRVASPRGGTIEVRLDHADGPVIAKIMIPDTTGWTVVSSALVQKPKGQHNLILTLPTDDEVSVDWIQFKIAATEALHDAK
jgi:hypothetical protein